MMSDHMGSQGVQEKHTSQPNHSLPTDTRYRLSRAEEKGIIRDRMAADMNRRDMGCGIRQYVS
jgi:hypothetical protein